MKMDPDQPPYISGAAVRRLTPMGALIAALKNAFVDGAASPPRQHYDLPGHGTLLLMPAWRGEVTVGVKVVTIYSRSEPSVQATYLLLDGRSGRPRAILDGTMITKRRTAAASALAADMLARPGARRLLVLGTGALVPHLVEAYRAVRPINEVSIWGRDHDKARACAAAIQCQGLAVQAVTDRQQALGRADIISAATLSTTALVTGADLNPGTHVDLIGASLAVGAAAGVLAHAAATGPPLRMPAILPATSVLWMRCSATFSTTVPTLTGIAATSSMTIADPGGGSAAGHTGSRHPQVTSVTIVLPASASV